MQAASMPKWSCIRHEGRRKARLTVFTLNTTKPFGATCGHRLHPVFYSFLSDPASAMKEGKALSQLTANKGRFSIQEP